MEGVKGRARGSSERRSRDTKRKNLGLGDCSRCDNYFYQTGFLALKIFAQQVTRLGEGSSAGARAFNPSGRRAGRKTIHWVVASVQLQLNAARLLHSRSTRVFPHFDTVIRFFCCTLYIAPSFQTITPLSVPCYIVVCPSINWLARATTHGLESNPAGFGSVPPHCSCTGKGFLRSPH